MDTVADPGPTCGDPLAGADGGCVTDDHDEIAPTPDLDLENAKAILGIMKGDALDCACERLKGNVTGNLIGSDHLVHRACHSSS